MTRRARKAQAEPRPEGTHEGGLNESEPREAHEARVTEEVAVNIDYLASRAAARKNFLEICDGRIAFGFIVLRKERKFEAFSRDGRRLGLYPTRRKAMAAIEASRRGWSS